MANLKDRSVVMRIFLKAVEREGVFSWEGAGVIPAKQKGGNLLRYYKDEVLRTLKFEGFS